LAGKPVEDYKTHLDPAHLIPYLAGTPVEDYKIDLFQVRHVAWLDLAWLGVTADVA
jgi:hypothetical protein